MGLDLGGSGEEAPEAQDVAHARLKDDAAVVLDVGKVAGLEEAVLAHRLPGCRLVAEVMVEKTDGLRLQLARQAHRLKGAVLRVSDSEPILRRRRITAALGPIGRRRIAALTGDQRLQLAGAVDADEGDATRIAGLDEGGQRGVEGGVAAKAQAGKRPLIGGRLQDAVEQIVAAIDMGDRVSVDQARRLGTVECHHRDQGPAGGDRRHGEGESEDAAIRQRQ